MSDLESALRVVGFLVAALGTLAAVPAGTWRLVARSEVKARRSWKRVIDLSKRVIDFLLRRKSGSAAGQVAAVSAAFGGSSALAADLVTVTGGSTEDRLTRVESRLDEAEKQQRKTAAALALEIADRIGADDAVRADLLGEVARLDRELDDQEKAAVEVDALALPAVLGGAMLSTFPDLFAANLVLGNLALCFSVGLFFYAWVLLDRARSQLDRASAG